MKLLRDNQNPFTDMNICTRFRGIRTAADHFYQFPTDLLILDYVAKHQIIASVKVGESFIHFLNNTKGPGPNRRKLLSWLLLCVWTRRSVFLWQGGVSPCSFRKHPRRRPSVLPSLQWLLCVLSDTDITATPLCGCCGVQHGGGGGDRSENERILLTQRKTKVRLAQHV